mgnify:CR=1 FL=1
MIKMSRPSSTITAAGLAGMSVTVFWGVIKTVYPDVELDPLLVSASTTLVAALVGYFKKENVLPLRDDLPITE